MTRENDSQQPDRATIVSHLERSASRLQAKPGPRTPAQAAREALASLFKKKTGKVKPLLLAFILASLAGCGSSADPSWLPVHPVRGKVLVDGKPAAGALLVLHPKGSAPSAMRPRAYVNADGSFELSTYVSNDGAPEGEYAVTIDLCEQIKKGNEAWAGRRLLPPTYCRPESSPLIVRIAQGDNELPIIVKK